MKRFLVLLALVAAPSLIHAQTTTKSAPVLLAKSPQEPLPKAQELLDGLYSPYEAAKTYRGTFDILFKRNDPKMELSEVHLKTVFQFDGKGNLARQNTLVEFVGKAKQRSTVRLVNNGGAPIVAVSAQKVWAESQGELKTVPFPLSFLKPAIESVVQGFKDNDDFVPVVSRGIEAGRPVFILKAKGTDVLRIIVDAQTRALRAFDLQDSFSMRGSEQSFDEPIADAEFAWTPPADFKKVAEEDMALPTFVTSIIKNKPSETAPAN